MIELKVVPPDPYDAVLADLRAKRDAIDNTIATLESLRDGRLGIVSAPPAPDQQATADSSGATLGAGAFLGMSIADATKKLLGIRKRSLGNAEILKDLQAGGLLLNSADPLNVIGSVLMRRFNNAGDIVRVRRGVWGLKEWYPGQTFKPTKAASSSEGQAAVQAPEDDETASCDSDGFDSLLGSSETEQK